MSDGRSGDFAVFMALWNAIYKKPAKALIFTSQILEDNGSFFPVASVKRKCDAAKAFNIPMVVGPKNFTQLQGENVLIANNLKELISINDAQPELKEQMMEEINAYKPRSNIIAE
jgi:hypothetical protein